jgi:hypothetical protein
VARQPYKKRDGARRLGHDPATRVERFTGMHEPEFGSITSLNQQVSLLEQQTGIASDPAAPVAGR